MAAPTAQGQLRDYAVWLRSVSKCPVPVALPTLGTIRPPRSRGLAFGSTAGQAANTGARCAIAHCELWPEAQKPFCHAHAATWRANGRPDVEAFCDGFLPVTHRADETIRLGSLGPQLKLEIQYALQCRRDEMTSKTMPSVVMRLVRFLSGTTATSLLDFSEATWRSRISQGTKDHDRRALLLYGRRKIEDLVDADGWEAEFPRHIWQLRRLGYDGNQTLDFTAVSQPWLCHLVKRWLRWRLATGMNIETVRRGLRSLIRFAAFCQGIEVQSLADIDRVVLERYRRLGNRVGRTTAPQRPHRPAELVSGRNPSTSLGRLVVAQGADLQ